MLFILLLVLESTSLKRNLMWITEGLVPYTRADNGFLAVMKRGNSHFARRKKMNRQSDSHLQKRSRTLFPWWIEGFRQTTTKMFSYKVLKYLHFSGENKVSSYEHMCDMFIWDKINSQVPPNMDRHLCFATLRDGTYFHEMHFQATSKNHMRMNKGPGPLADGQDSLTFPCNLV